MGHFLTPRSVLFTHNTLDATMHWNGYQTSNITDRSRLQKSSHTTYHRTVLLPNSYEQMPDRSFQDTNGQPYPHSKYWNHHWRIIVPSSVVSSHMTYHTTVLLPNKCKRIRMFWGNPKGLLMPPPHILDPSMLDWNQYQTSNFTDRAQLQKLKDKTYHRTTLLPNSCAPMSEGP